MKEAAAPAPPKAAPSKGLLVLQRCACGGSPGPTGECAECRKKQPGLQRKEAGAAPAVAPPIVHEVLRSPGRPLEPETRSLMENRFGHDFGHVRVHADAQAAESARAVGALAYTVGRDVVFGAGQLAPSSSAGRRLLAHELTHVAQQEHQPFAPGELEIGPENDSFEQAAQATADRISSNTPQPPPPFSSAPPRLGRSVLRRFTFGTAPGGDMVVVPIDHRPRVRAAMAILTRLTRDRRCREFFRDNCTAGLGTTELATAIADAEIYHLPEESQRFGSSDTRTIAGNPRKIAYNLTAFRIGRWELAATLLHEMFHTCILGTIPNEEVTAETAVESCHLFNPFILEVNPRSGPVGTEVLIRGFGFGPAQGPRDRITFNGVDAGTATSWVLSNTDSMIRVRIPVPAGATTGPVVVENNTIPSNEVTFTVT